MADDVATNVLAVRIEKPASPGAAKQATLATAGWNGGAIGAGAYPGKVIKGMKMAGQHGNSRSTALNVEVVKVDADNNLLFVRGGVPGHNDAIVRIRATVKGPAMPLQAKKQDEGEAAEAE